MKEKLLKYPKAGTIVACVMIVVVYMLLSYGTSFVCKSLFQDGIAGAYSQMAIAEGMQSLVSVLILWGVGYKAILKEKGQGFAKGLYIGGVWLGYAVTLTMRQLYIGILNTNSDFCTGGEITAFVITMLFVGVTEELLMRGVILNMLLDSFPDTRRGVWTAVIIESLIFGLIHFINILSGASFIGVFWQVVNATLGGMLLSAIYIRCRNIWTVIAIHGIFDFMALFQSGVLGMGTTVDHIDSVKPNVYIYLLQLFLAIYLLRNRKKEKDARRDGIRAVLFGLFSIGVGFTGIFWSVGVMGIIAAKSSLEAQPEKNKTAKLGMILSIIGTLLSIACAVGILIYFGTMSDVDKFYFLKKWH